MVELVTKLSAVQGISMQCRTVQCSAGQFSARQCSAVPDRYNILWGIEVHYSLIKQDYRQLYGLYVTVNNIETLLCRQIYIYIYIFYTASTRFFLAQSPQQKKLQ